MGRIEKGVKCSLIGCNDKAIRSLSFEKVESIGMKLEGERRAYLCEKH